MLKQDLRAGNVVRLRDGTFYMVMIEANGIALINHQSQWCRLSRYSDDLKREGLKEFDIMEVYGYSTKNSGGLDISDSNRPLLWKREELLPCPHCGNNKTVVVDQDIHTNCYRVVCNYNADGCGSSSGYRETKEEAIENWNTRAK